MLIVFIFVVERRQEIIGRQLSLLPCAWRWIVKEICPGKKKKRKERCSGSFHLAVGFLVIKDDSISERPG